MEVFIHPRSSGRMAIPATAFSFRAELGMRRPDDGRRLGSAVHRRPRRLELPSYGGVIEGIPADVAEYVLWEADDPFRLTLRGEATRNGVTRSWLLNGVSSKWREIRHRSHRNRMTTESLPFRMFQDARAISPVRLIVVDGQAPLP